MDTSKQHSLEYAESVVFEEEFQPNTLLQSRRYPFEDTDEALMSSVFIYQ